MTTEVKTTLHIQKIDDPTLRDDLLVNDAVDRAKAVYGEDIFMVLIRPEKAGEELAVRPDMAQFIQNPEKQYMRISTLSNLADIFECNNAIIIDGFTRSHRETTEKFNFYNFTDGRVLAVNPKKESLEKFGYVLDD